MDLVHQMKAWSGKHQPLWFVVPRAGLGICLFLKGFIFIRNTTSLELLISQTAIAQNISGLSTIIPWVHLLGGVMIVIGLYTRLAALIQIPILLGAVFFVNAKQGIFAGESSDLLFSIIILLLLIFFLLEGGGSLSLDNHLRPKKE